MNLRQVRKKIKSVSNVKKITRSMQLVSAIKMKKSQQEAIDSRPYQESLEFIIKKMTEKINIKLSQLLFSHAEKNNQRQLIIIVSANKGLCGSFNFDLFRFINKEIDFNITDFIVVGKKAGMFITKMGGNVLADFSASNPIINVSAVFKMLLDKFLIGSYRNIDIVYNQFISTLKIIPIKQRILPLTLDHLAPIEEKLKQEYLIEPSPRKILDSVLKSYIEEKIRNVLIQSEAGEHSARMIAMKNATDNANDVVYNLTLMGNKLRQEKITNELLDMITAKESVES